jgi:AraC-like DNA-binding protein
VTTNQPQYSLGAEVTWSIAGSRMKRTMPRRPVSAGRDRTRSFEEGFLDKAAVADLADRLGIGPRHLLRLFLEHAGATPSEVAATRRVQAAKRLIDRIGMPLSQISFEAGYRSIRRFNNGDLRTSAIGLSPDDDRKEQLAIGRQNRRRGISSFGIACCRRYCDRMCISDWWMSSTTP